MRSAGLKAFLCLCPALSELASCLRTRQDRMQDSQHQQRFYTSPVFKVYCAYPPLSIIGPKIRVVQNEATFAQSGAVNYAKLNFTFLFLRCLIDT